MPEIQAPGTDPSRPIVEPARFRFAITWSSLYVSAPGFQKSVVKSSAAASSAVTKPPSQPDFTWAMVVPKMYRPLPRRRRVSEIAPAPAPRPRPEPRRIELPRIAPFEPQPAQAPPAAAQIEKHFSFHQTCAIGVATALLAALAVYSISKALAPKRGQPEPRPSAAAVLHFPATPVAPVAPVVPQSVPERPIQKREPESEETFTNNRSRRAVRARSRTCACSFRARNSVRKEGAGSCAAARSCVLRPSAARDGGLPIVADRQ